MLISEYVWLSCVAKIMNKLFRLEVYWGLIRHGNYVKVTSEVPRKFIFIYIELSPSQIDIFKKIKRFYC